MTPTPFLIKSIEGLTPTNAIDIGCGNGRNAIYLNQAGWNVTAIDVENQSLRNIKFEQLKLIDLPVVESFNLVVCLMMLHFSFNKDEVYQNIAKLRKLTSYKGKLVLSVFTNENRHGSRPYLFGTNEIETYFSSWKILDKQHELAEPIIDNGEKIRYWVVRYLLEKW